MDLQSSKEFLLQKSIMKAISYSCQTPEKEEGLEYI